MSESLIISGRVTMDGCGFEAKCNLAAVGNRISVGCGPRVKFETSARISSGTVPAEVVRRWKFHSKVFGRVSVHSALPRTRGQAETQSHWPSLQWNRGTLEAKDNEVAGERRRSAAGRKSLRETKSSAESLQTGLREEGKQGGFEFQVASGENGRRFEHRQNGFGS